MKKTFLLGLIAIIITSCSNDDNQIHLVDASRRIVNETNHHLDIMVYDDVDTFQFNLVPNSTCIVEADCIEASFSDIYNCKIGWNILQYASIVFDSERIQRFELNENLECSGKAINGDIWMLNCSYEVIEKTTNSFIVEYRITQEDYENAEIL